MRNWLLSYRNAQNQTFSDYKNLRFKVPDLFQMINTQSIVVGRSRPFLVIKI